MPRYPDIALPREMPPDKSINTDASDKAAGAGSVKR